MEGACRCLFSLVVSRNYLQTNLIRREVLPISRLTGHAFVVVVTRPLPRDGGMAEDHAAPETGQLIRV